MSAAKYSFEDCNHSNEQQYLKPHSQKLFINQRQRIFNNKELLKQSFEDAAFWHTIILEILTTKFFSLSTLAEAIQVDKQWLLKFFLFKDENIFIPANIAESLLSLHDILKKDLKARD